MPTSDLLDRFLADFDAFLAEFISSAAERPSTLPSTAATEPLPSSTPSFANSTSVGTPFSDPTSAGGRAANLPASQSPELTASPTFAASVAPSSTPSPLADVSLSAMTIPQPSSIDPSSPASANPSTSASIYPDQLSDLASQFLSTASPDRNPANPTPDPSLSAPGDASPAASFNPANSSDNSRLVDLADRALTQLDLISTTLDRILFRLETLSDSTPAAIFA